MTVGAVLVLTRGSWAHVGMAIANHIMALEDRDKAVPRDVMLLMETAVELAAAGPYAAGGGQSLGAAGLVCDAPLMDGDRCISIDEAARYAAVSPRTIRRRAQEGALPSHKLGRRRVVRVRDLRRWIDTQKER